MRGTAQSDEVGRRARVGGRAPPPDSFPRGPPREPCGGPPRPACHPRRPRRDPGGARRGEQSGRSCTARAAFDPVGDSFTGLGIAQLAFGALGVLAISSEYTTGLIRTTFASAPRRRAVIAGKAAVVGAVSLLAGELIAFATFFTGQQAL